jgi:uncharacterized membrane protein
MTLALFNSILLYLMFLLQNIYFFLVMCTVFGVLWTLFVNIVTVKIRSAVSQISSAVYSLAVNVTKNRKIILLFMRVESRLVIVLAVRNFKVIVKILVPLLQTVRILSHYST